jgi:predicted component of type VI protein secretion system
MNVKMLVVQGRPAGKSLHFPLGDYYFGRGAECQVRPNSEWVSRQHCLLRVTTTGAFLRDLGSRNGTLINGELLHEERRLGHGDQVQLGQLVFEIQLEIDGKRTQGTNGGGRPLLDGLEPPSDAAAKLESAEDLPALTLPVRRKIE